MTRGYVKQTVDLASEEAAIKAVNEKQMAAYVARDYAGEAEVWAQEPYIVHYYSAAPDIGWDTISSRYRTNLDPASGSGRVYHVMTASNYDIRLNGNVAFVFYFVFRVLGSI